LARNPRALSVRCGCWLTSRILQQESFPRRGNVAQDCGKYYCVGNTDLILLNANNRSPCLDSKVTEANYCWLPFTRVSYLTTSRWVLNRTAVVFLVLQCATSSTRSNKTRCTVGTLNFPRYVTFPSKGKTLYKRNTFKHFGRCAKQKHKETIRTNGEGERYRMIEKSRKPFLTHVLFVKK
jgi:hypothetical protein